MSQKKLNARIAELEHQLKDAEQREQRLQQQLDLLNHALDLAGIGEWDIDLISGKAEPSDRWWRLLGYEKGEHDGHLDNMKKLHYPSDWDKGWEMIAEHLQGETSLYKNELRYLSKDNKWLWFRVIGKIFQRNDQGEPTRFAGISQNIMNERHLADELDKTKKELQQKLALKDSELSEVSKSLYQAQQEIQSLAGILPICSNCKKIRDDEGYWKQLEEYIEAHTDALFSHGLCEHCLEKLYRDEGWFKQYQAKLAQRKKVKENPDS